MSNRRRVLIVGLKTNLTENIWKERLNKSDIS